jgi:hypothetical protein
MKLAFSRLSRFPAPILENLKGKEAIFSLDFCKLQTGKCFPSVSKHFTGYSLKDE